MFKLGLVNLIDFITTQSHSQLHVEVFKILYIYNLGVSSSPPIPRSYKLREDKQEEVEEALARFSPAKKRAASPNALEQDDESPSSSGKRKRKRELDILMEDKKVSFIYLFFPSGCAEIYTILRKSPRIFVRPFKL